MRGVRRARREARRGAGGVGGVDTRGGGGEPSCVPVGLVCFRPGPWPAPCALEHMKPLTKRSYFL
jgi:hypothetical protein